MKLFLIFIGIFLIITPIFSQKIFEIENDKKFAESNPSLLRKIKKTLPDNSIFEIRIWISGGNSYPGKVNFILLANSEQIWSSKAFEFTIRKRRTEVIELTVNKDAELLWESLEKNEILTLPDMNELTDELSFINEDGYESKVVTNDGLNYKIEIISKYAKRKYQYYCPNAQLKKNLNNSELQKIVAILKEVYNAIGWPNEPC